RAARRGGAVEKGVSRPARGVLDRAPFPLGERADVDALADEPNATPPGKLRAEPLVIVGVRAAKEMIEMRDAGDRELAAGLELAQDQKQGDGVGAAGQAHQDPTPGPTQSVLLNRAPHGGKKIHS